MGTRDELSITLYLQSEINFVLSGYLSMLDVFIWIFSECTQAIATSLIPLVTNFSGFSFTVWTKMRPYWVH